MKRILALTLALIMLLGAVAVLSACHSDTVPTDELRLTVLKGPTGMGAAKLIYDYAESDDRNYTCTIAASADEVRAALMNGTTDIAAVPTNLASVLHNKLEGEIQIIALNTLGVLYMLENGDSITSVEDLRGKKIGATGQGSTPEYILNYILKENGIDPEKDVEITYYAEHAELATLLAEGKIDIGMLPEPNVSTTLAKSNTTRIALNLTEEWNKVVDDGSAVVQGCLVVRKSYLAEHKEAVDYFLRDYKASVEFAQNNLEEAANIIAEVGIVPSAAIAKAALPNSNIVCITGDEMQAKLIPFLNVLYSANPASVGGKVPGDELFYTGK